MNVLLLAGRVVDAEALRRAVGADLGTTELLVVAPAVNESKLAFLVSDADEAIRDAQGRLDATLGALREAGIRARGTTGDGEPMVALQDALATFPADRIVIAGASGPDVAAEAERRFRVPVLVAS